ncbi:MAG: sigma 54-interacting transcriptional regulator [Vicinamibacterales bacterium]
MSARLAIVDDDPAFAEFIQVLLRSRGYEVDAHQSGGALLEALRAGAAPQVILLDVSMPGLDGLETLRAIRQTQPTAQVIISAGRRRPPSSKPRLGAADYVLKPGDPDGVGEATLEAAIRNALERESLVVEVARLERAAAEDPGGATVLELGSGHAAADGPDGARCRQRHRRAHPRRERRGQGSDRARAPSAIGAPHAAVREGQLRRPAGRPPRERALRPRTGAFTGAGTTRVGKFEFANQGTVMLDEIGEMPASLQAKLLHVLQDREFTKLGSNRPVSVDVRIIAATNRDLEEMMRAGSFREDLTTASRSSSCGFRAARTAGGDHGLSSSSSQHSTSIARRRRGRAPSSWTPCCTDWPGNVRELENMMKRTSCCRTSVILSEQARRRRRACRRRRPRRRHRSRPHRRRPSSRPSPTRRCRRRSAPAASPGRRGGGPPPEPPPPAPEPEPARRPSMTTTARTCLALARAAAQEAERDAIMHALTRFRWNRRKAATAPERSYKTLLNKMKECGISDASSS